MSQNIGLIVVDALLNEDGAVGVIYKLAYSASGTFLATATISKAELLVTVWDLATCSLAWVFPAVSLPGILISLNWLGCSVFAANSAGKVYIFDCHQGTLAKEYELNRPEEELIAFLALQLNNLYFAVFRSGLVVSVDQQKGEQQQIRSPTENGAQVTSAVLHESGLMFLALKKGLLSVFDVTLRRELYVDGVLSLGTNVTAQYIAVHPALKLMAIALRDKSIRVIELDIDEEAGNVRLRMQHKLQDVVNKWNWNVCGFSHDGELVWGSFSATSHHLVYLWDTTNGAIARMLQGPKEDLVVALWNPKRPSIITGSVFGTLFRWVPDYPVRWSALVPGLQEIDENVEYIEREDEFDFTVEEDLKNLEMNNHQSENHTPLIDVLTRDPTAIKVESVKLDINSNNKFELL